MTARKIHILYEYGTDQRPHGSSYIRLLRPLFHPGIPADWQISFGHRLDKAGADVVIIDRLWRPDISPELAQGLVNEVRRSGARLVYTIDDNLLDLPLERSDWPKEHHLQALQVFLENADLVWVPTFPLKKRFSGYASNIAVIPNALDERLLSGAMQSPIASPFEDHRVVIGYMGTTTHDKDFQMILPALQEVVQRHPDELRFEMVGVATDRQSIAGLEGVPVRFIPIQAEEQEYPLFLFWFMGRVSWDIGLSPLRETQFNRCKSDIKFLDYSALGTAGVYSRVPAYENTVQHRETGWLAENDPGAWVEALEVLLGDEALRAHLARSAARYLYTQRVLKHSLPQWVHSLITVL